MVFNNNFLAFKLNLNILNPLLSDFYMAFVNLRWNNYRLVTMIFVVIKLCLHVCTNTNYELHRDEMLYFNMADHLSPGYATIPPVMAFLAFSVKSIFGYSVFFIRLIPAVLGAASIPIIAKIIRILGGGILAQVIAGVSFLLSPGFLLFDTLFTPNAIEQFLWLWLTLLLIKMVTLKNPKYWIGIGILTGLAFLNKYSVAVFIFGFLIALLFSNHRKIFRSGYFLTSILIAFVIFLPNLIWQYMHHWPVIWHMEELKRTQLVNRNYFLFFTEIFSLLGLSIVVCLFGFYSILFLKGEKTNRWLGLAILIIIFIFLLSYGKGYYILGVIPFLYAAGAYAFEKYCGGRFNRISYAVLFSIISYSIIVLPFSLPVLSLEKLKKYDAITGHLAIYPFSRWEDGKIHSSSQVYADMTGWKELTVYVAKAYAMLSAEDQKKCTIYGERNYGYAGAIHFYGRRYHLPEAITFLESYTIWAPDTIPHGPVIYINQGVGRCRELFNHITEIGRVKNEYFREDGLKIFLCSEPKTDLQEAYKQKAIEEKRNYR